METPALTARAIVSNGFCKFHLAALAQELSQRGRLALMLTGTYPNREVRRLAHLTAFDRTAVGQRLLQRGEDIPPQLVASLPWPEAMYRLRRVRSLPGLGAVGAALNAWSFRWYGRLCTKGVRRASANTAIYHYRAGMGGKSVTLARQLGLICLCDHSIAHPSVLEYMVSHQGQFPAKTALVDPKAPVERVIQADIAQADHVLVNSEFVKQTMTLAGYPSDRVSVAYLGVDDQFMSAIPEGRQTREDGAPIRFMFAGGFNERKGARDLVAAFSNVKIENWELTLAGSIDPAIARDHASFFADRRVHVLGVLSRPELARQMTQNDVFVFPSLAEGSARVIFEALACGMYVITTPNSGSIVEDGIHGALVACGEPQALAAAVEACFQDRSLLDRVGRLNADLVRSHYTQRHYGDRVCRLYDQLISERAKEEECH